MILNAGLRPPQFDILTLGRAKGIVFESGSNVLIQSVEAAKPRLLVVGTAPTRLRDGKWISSYYTIRPTGNRQRESSSAGEMEWRVVLIGGRSRRQDTEWESANSFVSSPKFGKVSFNLFL